MVDKLKRAFKAFLDDQMADRAAALTYYMMMSLFPALLVGVSLLGLLGDRSLVTKAVDYASENGAPAEVTDALEALLTKTVEAGGAVSLVFRAGPDLPAAEHTGIGLLVQEFAGDGQEVARKYLATDVRARPVVIGADEGVFLDGGDHYLFYTDPTGADVYEDGRLVGNALILTRGTLTIRLEGDLPLDRMVAIAESLR